MTIHTIGYALSQVNKTSQTHIAPALFYNTPETSHLSWIGTIYPKDNHAENNLKTCSLQLSNYIQYYQQKRTLVIGGDISALFGISAGYNHNYQMLLLSDDENILPAPYMDLLAHQTDLKQIIALHDIHSDINQIGKHQLTDNIDDLIEPQKPLILVIDASFLAANNPHKNDHIQILKQLKHLKPQTLAITNYSPNNDNDQETFKQLLTWIKHFTTN
ncbi:hypothetical protein [Candidatus Synchoanobacter obligatus]|uniref:Uncharacterized protein n=1 Tax=Candidatus Synchoanobacter obligatus TaxID=2919597 RepID=A0ABT1L593_9GAMM|nr:hypothetical protein [Candidatus Synchoanobacter obligatus]MCP8352349.1 hypothetical protein [Candidatus Synchoanobacter obligatus]